jgi:DNA gyrase subunit A
MSDEIQPSVQADGSDVQNVNIEHEMSSSYIDYSMSVIVGRALPDARDGLKPVHRRVLFAMNELGNFSNKPYKKSARVVGDVIGKYHPHGDVAVYDTIVRLAQDFSMRYPLVDGQGNFGSVDGDPPAAMRYTEVRMDKLGEEMLVDLDKDTVDFMPNYDESCQEPVVLPSRLPNLLLNGSTGIAVGMATNIPPHNLGELVDGFTYYIDHPMCTVDDLMQFVKGPDFPTGGVIMGTRQIESMYKIGRGQMTVRGKAEIVDYKNNRQAIIITEIPYVVNKAAMIEHMADLVNNKEIDGISDIRDESSEKGGMRIVIELKRGTFGKVVLDNLYKRTQLQTTFGAIMLAIDQGRPKVLNLKELFRCWIDHRFEVLTRRTKFELAKAEARKHILDGLLLALDHLDEVVHIIRGSKNRDDAKVQLMARFGFSEKQVNAILDMKLYQLTGLERDKVQQEHDDLVVRIEYLKGILADPQKIYGLIKADLQDLKEKYVIGKKYGKRLTEIRPQEGEINLKQLIADEPCVITLSNRGYVKRVKLSEYREQNRGGRGVTGAAVKGEDFVKTVFIAATHDTLLFFTNTGRVFAKDAYELYDASRTSIGTPIVNFLQLQDGESVAALLPIRAFAEDVDVFFVTEEGTVKKTALADFRNVHKAGIRALNIDEGDHLMQVKLTHAGEDVILVTSNGYAMRFTEDQVRRMGRTATGVKGISFRGEDKVCAFDVVDSAATFLIVTENGFGKRSAFDDFPRHHRGGLGVIAIKDNEGGRNGKVVAAFTVKDGQSMISLTSDGKVVRSPVADIRTCGRGAMGVRLVRMDEGQKVVSVSIADPVEDQPAAAPKAETPVEPAPASEEPPAESGQPPAGGIEPSPDNV